MGRYMMRFINATAFIRRISIKKVIAWAVILVCALIGFLIYKSDIGVTYVFCDSVQHKVMSFSEKTPEEIVAKAGITLDSENSLVLDYYKPEVMTQLNDKDREAMTTAIHALLDEAEVLGL